MTLTPRRRLVARFLLLSSTIVLFSATAAAAAASLSSSSLSSGTNSLSHRLRSKRFLINSTPADDNATPSQQPGTNEDGTTVIVMASEEPAISEMSNTTEAVPDVPTTTVDSTPSRCAGFFDCGDICIPKVLECDTEGDCTHNEDEQNCPQNCKGANMFKCQDGGCISLSRRCDEVSDCWDDSDEVNCHSFPCDTTGNYFRCTASGACLDKEFRCDHYDDCYDGSDETNCPN